jgi:hypothetical protein
MIRMLLVGYFMGIRRCPNAGAQLISRDIEEPRTNSYSQEPHRI